MRKWIIENCAYQYSAKVFGKVYKHPRVVNVIIPLFCAGGLINLLIPGFSILQLIVLLPTFIVYFGGSKLFVGEIAYKELDWEQKLMFLARKKNGGDLALYEQYDFDELQKYYDEKYHGKEKFVNSMRFFFPAIIILTTLLIFGVFGFNEAGFTNERFF